MTKVAIVANIPAPYREKVYEGVENYEDLDLRVFYCRRLESNRKWKFNLGRYPKKFLDATTLSLGDKYYHFSILVWVELSKFKPEVVVTTSFSFAMLLSFFWAKLNGSRHVCFTDGTVFSESHLTWFHRIVRRFIFSKSSAFVGASNGSEALYKSYGVSTRAIFRSCLCIDNNRFSSNLGFDDDRRYDLLFSGRFTETKLPFFFAEVAKEVSSRVENLKVLVIGSGHLEGEFVAKLERYDVDYQFRGFVQQNDLPQVYRDSRFLLFPTKNDTWGVVANEACASGCVVVTNAAAGVSGDLIIDGETGLVLPLDVSLWADRICELYGDSRGYNSIKEKALKHVQEYNHDKAANGIYRAVKFALQN